MMTKQKGSTWKRLVGGAISISIVVWVFAVAIPKFSSYGDMFNELRQVSLMGLVMLGVATGLNVVAYSALWSASIPGLRLRDAVVMTQASAGVNNALPAGGPISMGLIWAMLKSWGFKTTRIVQGTTVSGIWNALIKLAIPVLALGLLALEKKASKHFLILAVVGVVVLAVVCVLLALMLRSEGFARRLGRTGQAIVSKVFGLAHKPPVTGWDNKAAEIRSDTVELLRLRWREISLTALGTQLAFFLVLLVSLRVVGVPPSSVTLAEAFASYAFIRLVTTIPITPGGVGITQLGLVGMLSALADPSMQPKIAAGVMIYTALTYLVTFPLGGACYVIWRVQERTRDGDDEQRSDRGWMGDRM